MKYIKFLMIILLFIVIFAFFNVLLKPKYMTSLVEGSMTSEYYKEEKNHEIIFIGDCEVYANFSPMVLYKEYGITSYVRGNSQQLIWQSYGLLKETLKYEIPKIVILNVNSMRYSEPVSEAYNRLMLDNMKWSKEKFDIIMSSKLENENIISYLFPLLRYHSRFSELTSEDFEYLFKKKSNTFNGFLINTNIKPLTHLPTQKKLSNYTFSDIDYEYLDKIRVLCEKNNIKLVLIKAPSLYPYWYDEYEKQIIEYSNKYNLKYYNLLKEIDNIGLNYQLDTYDGGLHLNLYGATKLSIYFGRILVNNFELTDYRKVKEVSEIYNTKFEKYNKEISRLEEN